MNSGIHILLAAITSKLMKTRIRRKMIILSLIILNLFLYFYLLKPSIFTYYRIPVGLLLVFLSIKTNKNFLIVFLTYFLFNLLLGGIVEIINLNNLLILLVTFVLTIIIELLRDYLLRLNLKENLYFDCLASINCKRIKVKGFLDTGNELVFDEKPVIFLNKKYEKGIPYKNVKYQNVSEVSVVKLYQIEEFQMLYKGNWIRKEVYVSYTDSPYDCILNLYLLEGTCLS